MLVFDPVGAAAAGASGGTRVTSRVYFFVFLMFLCNYWLGDAATTAAEEQEDQEDETTLRHLLRGVRRGETWDHYRHLLRLRRDTSGGAAEQVGIAGDSGRTLGPAHSHDLLCPRDSPIAFRLREHALRLLEKKYRLHVDKFRRFRDRGVLTDGFSGVERDVGALTFAPQYYDTEDSAWYAWRPRSRDVVGGRLAAEFAAGERYGKNVAERISVVASGGGGVRTSGGARLIMGNLLQFSYDATVEKQKPESGRAPEVDTSVVCWVGETVFNLMAGEAWDELVNFRLLLEVLGDGRGADVDVEAAIIIPNRVRPLTAFLREIDRSVARAALFGLVMPELIASEVGGRTGEDGQSRDAPQLTPSARLRGTVLASLSRKPVLLHERLAYDLPRLQTQEDFDLAVDKYVTVYGPHVSPEEILDLFYVLSGGEVEFASSDATEEVPRFTSFYGAALVQVVAAAMRSTWPLFGALLYSVGRFQQIVMLEAVLKRVDASLFPVPTPDEEARGHEQEQSESSIAPTDTTSVADLFGDLDNVRRGYSQYHFSVIDKAFEVAESESGEGDVLVRSAAEGVAELLKDAEDVRARRFASELKRSVTVYEYHRADDEASSSTNFDPPLPPPTPAAHLAFTDPEVGWWVEMKKGANRHRDRAEPPEQAGVESSSISGAVIRGRVFFGADEGSADFFAFFSLLRDDDALEEIIQQTGKEQDGFSRSSRLKTTAAALTPDPAFLVTLLLYVLHEIQLLLFHQSTCPAGSHAVLTRGVAAPYLQCASEKRLDFELQNGGFRARGYLSGSANFKKLLQEFKRPSSEVDGGTAHLRSGCDTIVDVGANVGGYSLYFAYELGYDVLAVEPHPENVANLEGSIAANDYDVVAPPPRATVEGTTIKRGRITVVSAALVTSAKKEKQDKLFLYERPEETGQSALYTDEQARQSREVDYLQSTLETAEVAPGEVRRRIAVELRTLDAVVEEYVERVNPTAKFCMLKIDAEEGAAYDILKSGEGFLREHRPLVVVELDSAIGRTVWPPVLPVAPISAEKQHDKNKIRPGSIGAAVVDFLSGRTSSSSSGGSGLGYAKFTALEDYQDEGSQEAHEFVAWQVGLLKTLKLGVWTAIFYDAVRWDRRYSQLVRELPFEHLEHGSSEPEGENEAARMAEKEFWIALDAHFPAASTLENGGALDGGRDEVDKRLFLDRLHILCARECLRTVNEASCRCFDADGREGGSCRLFSSCAGFEGVEPLIALDEGEGAGHKFIPKMPKMGTLSAWGGGEEVEELSHFRAMELDNDLVAWPAPHRHSSSSHSEKDL
eukprot:g6043.t1